jgi:hypothetical protein
MNIKSAFAKAFGTTHDDMRPNVQKIISRRIGDKVTTSSNKMHTLGINTTEGFMMRNDSLGPPQFGQTFSQPSFGSVSGSFNNNNKPYHPFEFLDSLEKAKLIKQFLIERGVKRINEETAKALFLVSCVLKDQVLPPVKQAKKKLII